MLNYQEGRRHAPAPLWDSAPPRPADAPAPLGPAEGAGVEDGPAPGDHVDAGRGAGPGAGAGPGDWEAAVAAPGPREIDFWPWGLLWTGPIDDPELHGEALARAAFASREQAEWLAGIWGEGWVVVDRREYLARREAS